MIATLILCDLKIQTNHPFAETLFVVVLLFCLQNLIRIFKIIWHVVKKKEYLTTKLLKLLLQMIVIMEQRESKIVDYFMGFSYSLVQFLTVSSMSFLLMMVGIQKSHQIFTYLYISKACSLNLIN